VRPGNARQLALQGCTREPVPGLKFNKLPETVVNPIPDSTFKEITRMFNFSANHMVLLASRDWGKYQTLMMKDLDTQ
jgi:hypothetical protein